MVRRGMALPALPASVMVACLLVASCVIRSGSDPSSLAVADGPNGVSVNLDWREVTRTVYLSERAELVAVADSGVYLLHDELLVFYPVGVNARLRPYRAHGVPVLDLRDPTPEALMDFSTWARHPFGLEPQLLDRLVEAQGQDSVLVRRRR